MTNEEILDELLHELHVEGIFKEVVNEVNKLQNTHINNTQLELFEKAAVYVRRNKTI
jgi:hypothetical protein